MTKQNIEWRWTFHYIITGKVILLTPPPNSVSKFVRDSDGFVSRFEVGPITTDNFTSDRLCLEI
jgi:hypothetical protein